jgi:hypothetical protein
MKIGHSIWKNQNSGSYFSEWVLPHTGSAEVQKCISCCPLCPRGWLRSARRRLDNLLLFYCMYWYMLDNIVFSFQWFFNWAFCLGGLTFFVAGCNACPGHDLERSVVKESEGVATVKLPHFFSKSCQYPQIICQKILITLFRFWQRVWDNLQKHLQERAYPITKRRN